MTPTKSQRHNAILEVVNRGSVHTQQDIATAIAWKGVRATQATISRDIQELGLVRAGSGYRSSAALVRECAVCAEQVRAIDEAADGIERRGFRIVPAEVDVLVGFHVKGFGARESRE